MGDPRPIPPPGSDEVLVITPGGYGASDGRHAEPHPWREAGVFLLCILAAFGVIGVALVIAYGIGIY